MKTPFRAPADHGALLCEPPLELITQLASKGICRHYFPTNTSQWVAELGASARKECAENPSFLGRNVDPEKLWIGTGHQPELFHPGVWVKNFLTCGMAKSFQAEAFHVVIDTDCPTKMAIRLPQIGSISNPACAPWVSFGSFRPNQAWVSILGDPSRLNYFCERLADWSRIAGWNSLLPRWLHLFKMAQPGQLLWQRFHFVRENLENEMGCYLNTLRLSRMAELTSFRKLIFHMVLSRRSMRESYNASLALFRIRHKFQSSKRPIPDLEIKDGWEELPLWLAHQDGIRSRCWVRECSLGKVWEMSAEPGGAPWIQWTGQDPEDAVAALHSASSNGIHVWPRALSTTLFLRLFIFDWFVHGIGGALYDEVTEDWSKLWLGCDLMQHTVASLTLKLPLPSARASLQDYRESLSHYRRLWWNPDAFLGKERTGVEIKIAEKLVLWRQKKTQPGNESKRRFFEIRNLVDQLRSLLGKSIKESWATCQKLHSLIPELAIYNSREYAFPLHCVLTLEKHLRPLLLLKNDRTSN